jgi:hypothetical protein
MEVMLGTMKTRMERNGILFFGNLHVLVGSIFSLGFILSKLNNRSQAEKQMNMSPTSPAHYKSLSAILKTVKWMKYCPQMSGRHLRVPNMKDIGEPRPSMGICKTIIIHLLTGKSQNHAIHTMRSKLTVYVG